VVGGVRVVRVQPDVPAIHRAFDYTVPDALAGDVRVGTIVRVPLGGRRVRGWVLDDDVTAPEAEGSRLRDIAATVSDGPPADVVALCQWAAWRWAGPLATMLRAASPPNVVAPGAPPDIETAVYPTVLEPTHPWRGDALIVWQPADDPNPVVATLVTPEGSTLVVDPDPVRAARLVALLLDEGRDVVVIRSDHSAADLTAAWDRARVGACVVVGGRTAVWAPLPDLATVVVVDEGDEALEDERAPTWNARDVAIERARRADAPVRMITPAPTLDALDALGTPRPLTPARSPRMSWPRVQVVDPRDDAPGQGLLTTALADALRRARDDGGRSVCVLNRRGRARLLACVTCSELARCERCGATVVERDAGLACPRCTLERPKICTHCHGTKFRALRPGVNKVRDDLAALLPRASVAAVDTATDEVPDADVLIGTEAVLHRAPVIPDRPVRLVAFLELDQELLAPRVRAAEQALWLLVRAARLLGPRADGGVLLLQTRVPEHEVVQAAVDAEPLVVAESERPNRRALGFPPFGGLAELSGDVAAVAHACDALRAAAGSVPERGSSVTVLGPVDDGKRALVRAPTFTELCDALALPDVDAAHAVGRLRVDVDPRRV
jgi:primosomal protein N' (replication factor Y) (superfamily II helicase)